jgi:hypothetical protein
MGGRRSHEWNRREIYAKLYYLILKERDNLEDPGKCRKKRNWGLCGSGWANLVKCEGKSLNNSNLIVAFLQEYLQKLFLSYFST